MLLRLPTQLALTRVVVKQGRLADISIPQHRQCQLFLIRLTIVVVEAGGV